MAYLVGADIGTTSLKIAVFDEEGNLLLNVTSDEEDLLFDEIGSVLKVKQYQNTKQELLEALELYYRAFFLNEDIASMLEE